MKTRYSGAIIGLLLAASCAATSDAAEPVRWIEDFQQQKADWKRLAEAQTRIKVEGRCSTLSRNAFQFRGSDLWFRSADEDGFSPLPGISGNVEAEGRLTMRRNEYTFVVEKLSELPSDVDAFRRRSNLIPDSSVAEWYALGDWAARRGEFYQDADLVARSQEAYTAGIKAERSKLRERDAEGLFALADKAATFKLMSLRQELVYEGCQLAAHAARKQKALRVDPILERMSRDLSGSTEALKKAAPGLEAAYRKDPLLAYHKADVADRTKLHRIFYRELLLESILSEAAPDDSNGYEIAKEIEKSIPELGGLAQSYRDRQLKFEVSRVNVATRVEMTRLADRFREAGQPEKAAEATRQWLKSKEAQHRSEGPAGLQHLAEEYLNLLGDKARAAQLLIEAYGKSPGQEFAEQLDRLGYRLRDGRWVSQDEAKSLPDDPLQEAMRKGLVSAGMTPAHVTKSLGGAPAQTTRVATAGQVDEFWTYGRRSGTRLTIHFRRSSGTAAADGKVVQVMQHPSR